MVTIKIETDNAAFRNDDNINAAPEVARILMVLAKGIASAGFRECTLYDQNGKICGSVKVTA